MESEREWLTRLYWLLCRDGAEPRHVVVYPCDLYLDIVLPAEPDGPVQVVGDEW